jgi:hypothetical protein
MDVLYDGFQIRQNGNTSVTIRGYTGSSRCLSIPAAINEISVRVIDKRAFKFNGLSRVDLPPGIVCIEEEAFSKNFLEEVVLYPALSLICTAAFYKNRIKNLRTGKKAGRYLLAGGKWVYSGGL